MGRHRRRREDAEPGEPSDAAWQAYLEAKNELVPPDSEEIAPMAVWDKFLRWWEEVT